MKLARRGFSLIELLIVVAIILILIVAGLNRYTNAQELAHQAAALQAIRTLHTAEVQYNAQYNRYAVSLAELGPPAGGPRTASGAGIILPDLASGVKTGYKFTLTGDGASYVIHAEPVIFGGTGERTYYSDEAMAIRFNTTREPATAESVMVGMEGK